MEVINKKHDKIFVNERVKLASYIKFESDKRVYLSAGAVREFGVYAGLFIHFINDGDEWFFYSDADEDGFELIRREDKNAVLICNSALISLFLKRTRCSIPCKFSLKLTNAKHNGNHLVKIDLNAPIEYKEVEWTNKKIALKKRLIPVYDRPRDSSKKI